MNAPSPNPWLVPRDLIARYDTRGPRYTSYPTAVEWRETFTQGELEALVAERREQRRGVPLSLYLHIPFCVKLCYYCACNRKITRSDATVARYLDGVYKEIASWARELGSREVVQIHWGGGTPTHLSPELIEVVFGMIAQAFPVALGAEVSIEVHPPVTTREHLEALRRCGFNRLSMGIQDFDPKVQEAVNRIQPFEQTRGLIEDARRLGFSSINVDLIYGLPFQTLAGFTDTLDKVEALSPDRVALFNYAHMPSREPGQRMIRAETLPTPAVKLDLFEAAISRFIGLGYAYIGMDHFARPDDELARAKADRTLRRNFMGYTTCADSDLVGMGMSAISDLDTCYLQNHRGLREYNDAMATDALAVARGMRLTDDDRLRRDVIARLICHCALDFAEVEAAWGIDFRQTFAAELAALAPLADDGLLDLGARGMRVAPRGQILLRNVCMPFDAYLEGSGAAAYSRTV